MKSKTLRYVAAVALLVLVGSLFVVWTKPRSEEIRSSSWDAASISGKPAHDYWIEYHPYDKSIVVSTYRDYDGDGLVDERITFCGPIVAIYKSTKHDGYLDTVRNVLDPNDQGEPISRDAPEAGPFTRAKLDENARTRPRADTIETNREQMPHDDRSP